MLPRVKISFANGALGLVAASADGVLGFLCTGVTVSTTFVLATAYVLRSLDSLTALGVTAINNPAVYKLIKDFYSVAANGTECWLMAFPDTVSWSQMVDVTDAAKAKALINAANGRLRGLVVSRLPAGSYTPTITAGLDADVALAETKAQALAVWARDTKFAPVYVIIEGYAYSGVPTALADLTTHSNNRVGILIGDTALNSKSAAVGLFAGRKASIPVQRNIGRVKDGPVTTNAMYIADKAVEVADVESIHDKGYITFRTFVGRSGYFFNDDFMATLPTDDYSHLTAVDTAHKAYRIAYDTVLDELLDELAVNEDGTMQLPIIKSIEAKVENAIANAMTAKGELSADATNADDKGVQCVIDPTQNVVGSSQFNVGIRVRPFGYPRFINVDLGFTVIS